MGAFQSQWARLRALLQGLGPRALFTFLSVKAVRGGPRLLSFAGVFFVALIVLSWILPVGFSDVKDFGSNYLSILTWRPSKNGQDGLGEGLRIVVFGGGDVASPNKTLYLEGGPDASWTEVLCQELDCLSHITYMPTLTRHGGSLVSNSIYATALGHITERRQPDFSWMLDQYPVPEIPDLQRQIDAFLTSPPPEAPPRETLWVFNVGYWDVWYLSTLPLNQAKALLHGQVKTLFENIEVLYNATRLQNSTAYSDFYPELDGNTTIVSVDNSTKFADLPPEPFRIMIPRLFDISLTPGFQISRFGPPYPHSRAEEMRNAANLTAVWDMLIDRAIYKWIRTTNETITLGVNQTLAIEKYNATGYPFFVPPSRREAINVDVPAYLRDVMIDRQTHNSHVKSKKLKVEGFMDVETPCFQFVGSPNATGSGPLEVVCNNPDLDLFWDDFTVSQRAVNEIGHVAAERYRKHVKAGFEWLKGHTDLDEPE